VDFIILKCTKRHWIYIFNKIYVLDKEMKNNVKNYYKYNSIILKPGVLSIATNEKKFNESEINILCNSRIVKYKRLEDLIYLGEKLNVHKKIFRININAPIEDNHYYNILKKEIQFYNLHKNITINTNHFKDDNDLLETYNKNDIFIFPSENQTWGQAVLEAMALGMVVIVSKGCGIHSIIENGINGFVYETGNINELIRIILGIDKIKFELISSNAVNFVKKNYDWNHSVNLIINE
jgi:glycosyltransferase involved in cell wall biosynthesis